VRETHEECIGMDERNFIAPGASAEFHGAAES
jgi:hypothetical protein